MNTVSLLYKFCTTHIGLMPEKVSLRKSNKMKLIIKMMQLLSTILFNPLESFYIHLLKMSSSH